MTSRSLGGPRDTHSPVDERAVRQSLGGYRLLRVIGAGSRSLVYLGSDATSDVALKAVDDTVSAASFAAEAACLSSAWSPHVVRALDVSIVADQPRCLILERLPGPTIATLLSERAEIEQGEAVTLAVSVLRGVLALHLAGWTHGSLSLSKVRLDAAGRPVLIGFGRAALATAAGVQADWIAVADAVDSVLHRVENGDHRSLTRCIEVIRSLASQGQDEPSRVENAQRELFALGPAAPVSLPSGEAPSTEGYPHRPLTWTGLYDTAQALLDPTHPRESGSSVASRAASLSADRLRRALSSLAANGLASTITTRARSFLRARRRPLVLAVGVSAVFVLGALLVVPASGSAGHAVSDSPADVRVDPSRTRPSSRSPSPSPSHREAASTDELSREADPVSAALILLTRRSDYLGSADLTSLATIEQDGSPILAADSALASSGRHTPVPPIASQLSLAESLGDAAVIDVAPLEATTTQPASILMIRTDAGWRLRELYEN